HAFTLSHAQCSAILRMDQRRGALLAFHRAWRLGKGRIEKSARRRRYQPERLFRRRVVDHTKVIWQVRHFLAAATETLPVRTEMKLAVGVVETIQKVHLLERIHEV